MRKTLICLTTGFFIVFLPCISMALPFGPRQFDFINWGGTTNTTNSTTNNVLTTGGSTPNTPPSYTPSDNTPILQGSPTNTFSSTNPESGNEDDLGESPQGLTTGDTTGFDINTESHQGQGTNAPVPEPATMLLLGSGLIFAVSLKKKFQKNQ